MYIGTINIQKLQDKTKENCQELQKTSKAIYSKSYKATSIHRGVENFSSAPAIKFCRKKGYF